MSASGGNTRIRLWQPGDESVLPQLANNRRIWRNLTDGFPHPYGIAEAVEWIGVANENPRDTRHFAVLEAGEIVGGVGFERSQGLSSRTAEIGYWVAEPYWGRGIATRALRMATQVAFDDFDFVRLQASVLDWNPASRRVLEKAGYTLEARQRKNAFKDGEVCDIMLFVRLREDHPAP